MRPLADILYDLLAAGDRAGARAAIADAVLRRLDEAATLQAASVCIEGAAVEEARTLLRHARTLRPDATDRVYDLAAIARMAGDLDEARALCRQALDADPEHVDALALAVELAREADLGALAGRLKDAARRPRPHDAAARLDYARAQVHHRQGDFGAAFDAAVSGANRLRARIRYDVRADLAAMDGIARTQTRQALARRAPSRHRDAPIFVCGLPRTGTTLVEQIILRGGDAAPVGESSALSRAVAVGVRQLAPAPRAPEEALARLLEIDPDLVGAQYLEGIALPRGGAARTLDKALLNFLSAGLLPSVFPSGRTILMERDPRDCVASIFRTYFGGLFPFALDPLDLAHYVAAFRRLAAHWRATLDPGLFAVASYEDLVAAPAPKAQALCAFVGVPWTPTRLDPNAGAAAPIATSASAVQVRAPVHDRSVGAWRDYEPWLGAAFEIACA